MANRSTYGGVLALTAMAALVTACLSSAGLAEWADALPDCAVSRLASKAAHGLDNTMVRYDVDRPELALQGLVRRVEGSK